ncbi:MAG: helix-turn-helix transcriptional regulator [Hyphomicrobiaceae bacterium]
MDERLLPIAEVRRRVPVHRATIYRWIKAGAFPAPVALSPTCVMWRASEIDAWIAARPATSSGRQEGPLPAGDRPSADPPTPGR